MKKLCACLAFSACLGLASCAPQDCRMVDALNGGQFVAMSRAMRPVMLKKNMVDAEGNWYSPLFASRPSDAGKTLVDRLSPAFRFPHSKVAVAPTFRAMLTPEAKVKLEGSRAVMEDGMNRVELELVAVTDWNNDGVDDWLVLCRSGYSDTPRRFREYYLVIIDLKAPVLQPYVLMVLDHVYNRVTVQSDASAGELAESNAVEYVQGQAVVTQAPDRGSMQKKLEEGSRLKETSLSR
ncbi:hypothetical protein [Mailhella massiliensis]|uniref:Lipoprotein n=1 Tax=Mailhella massiliensis TaxID=1903261 RepID=A0A921AUX9_9BACT|nr:hypothetical protein [Mailhella massiliensis]HJD96314.1 hypothetical protein [Mailhella massiliensis]